jgi:uncharacterized protein YsxB (DUF464 family)
MLRVDVILDREGLLEFTAVQGHAGAGPKGGDPVCAAVSVLLRTLLRTLSGRRGITVQGEPLEGDVFALEAAWSPEGKEFLAAAGAFFIEGISSVAEENPDHCKFTIWRN